MTILLPKATIDRFRKEYPEMFTYSKENNTVIIKNITVPFTPIDEDNIKDGMRKVLEGRSL